MEQTQDAPEAAQERPFTAGCIMFGLALLAAFAGGMILAFALMGMASGG